MNEKNTTQVSIAKCVIVNKKNLLCYCCLLNSYEEKNAGKASELFRNSKKGSRIRLIHENVIGIKNVQ